MSKREDPALWQLYFQQCEEVTALQLENKRLRAIVREYQTDPTITTTEYRCVAASQALGASTSVERLVTQIQRLEEDKMEMQARIVELQRENTRLFNSHLSMNEALRSRGME